MNSEVVESEGVVLSPSSVSQMLCSPGGSTIEEVFAPHDIMNSPLDDLIREVSVSPTEELLGPESTTITVPSLNPVEKITKKTNNLSKKKAKKDINPTMKKKPMLIQNDNEVKKSKHSMPYIIKVEPTENDDPPVISIPDVDFIEPEELVYILILIIVKAVNLMHYTILKNSV